jgi:hypothetical protein
VIIFDMVGSGSLELLPNGSALPLRCEERGSRRSGLALAIMGAALILAFAGTLLAAPVSASDVPKLVVFSVLFPVLPGLAVYLGVMELKTRKLYSITPKRVDFKRVGFRPASWSVPFSEYRSVVKDSRVYSSANVTRRVYYVALKHSSDEKKDVVLYWATQRRGVDREWHHFSRLFGLPALEGNVNGVKLMDSIFNRE